MWHYGIGRAIVYYVNIGSPMEQRLTKIGRRAAKKTLPAWANAEQMPYRVSGYATALKKDGMAT
ncbi:hypothetical protein BDQ94DRAFT_154787 [Aspergillus welwitschiae]|uniref:Uncharacterized protein n=1 Tax=Aspergillus welwitschiae TaxID=1341132 RepID=A0A3F3PJ15_9EURO|nr:hypothetical protein BDQ94DRAFT_154787 [Aspergillus welwitschiae]RDH26931.1 hypothetical protein BDQ94DRAFT_154787 [Aspergillus welwitschiae]